MNATGRNEASHSSNPVQSEPVVVPRLLSISKLFRSTLGYKLGEIGLHLGQDEMLMALNVEDPKEINQVADMLGIRSSTVSKMTDKLVERGFVVRGQSDRDRRATTIALTASGEAIQPDIERIWADVDAGLTRNLQSELDEVDTQLRDVDQRLSARLRRRR